jgi:hypothetical protein
MSCVVSLAIRPVLFALTRALGEAWPADVPRDMLVARAFGAKLADGSHRARLRVEMGRLRTVLRPWRGVSATKQGFALAPRRAGEVVVLARPVEERHGTVLAFLADGESWSSLAWRQPAHRAAGARATGRNGGDRFFCGGGSSGKVSAVRRPAPGFAVGSGSETPVHPTSN